jgi:hypothetical protein
MFTRTAGSNNVELYKKKFYLSTKNYLVTNQICSIKSMAVEKKNFKCLKEQFIYLQSKCTYSNIVYNQSNILVKN